MISSNNVFYKDLCFVWEDKKAYSIEYANDKYIFLKEWVKIDNKSILKVEEVEGFLRENLCGKKDK